MASPKSTLSIPDNLFASMAAAEQKHGLPAGTMMALMQQEIGGNNKYLQDPAAYHYGLNAEGRRVAPHTGKVSTAFGPFGILESTAAQPGYGVTPLKSKDINDQIEFAAAYAAARAKQAGSLEGGLAAYGEGSKYGKQVMARIPGSSPSEPVPAPVPDEAPLQLAQAPQQEVPAAPASAGYVAPDAGNWKEFQKALPARPTPEALNFDVAAAKIDPLAYAGTGEVNFRSFVPKKKARV